MSKELKNCDFLDWLKEATSGGYGYPYWNDPQHIFYGDKNMQHGGAKPGDTQPYYPDQVQNPSKTANTREDPTVINSPLAQVSQKVTQLWDLYQTLDQRLSSIEKGQQTVAAR